MSKNIKNVDLWSNIEINKYVNGGKRGNATKMIDHWLTKKYGFEFPGICALLINDTNRLKRLIEVKKQINIIKEDIKNYQSKHKEA